MIKHEVMMSCESQSTWIIFSKNNMIMDVSQSQHEVMMMLLVPVNIEYVFSDYHDQRRETMST